MSTEVEKLEQKVSALAEKLHNIETGQLLSVQDREHLNEKLEGINKRLDKHDSNMSKLLWIIISAVVSFVVVFALNGGFAGGAVHALGG